MIPQSQFRSCKRALRERKQCIELLVMLSVSLIITDECGTFEDAKKEIAHWTLIMVERETTDDATVTYNYKSEEVNGSRYLMVVFKYSLQLKHNILE